MLHLPIHTRLREALWDTLLDSHRIRTKIHIHDSDEKRVSSFDFDHGSRLVSGAVQVDSTADVTRSLSLETLDPKHRLIFTPNSPAHGAIFSGYFLSAEYSVYVPPFNLFPRSDLYPAPDLYPGDPTPGDAGIWVDIPVFWGPLTKFSSAGALVTLEAQGKEALALAPNYANQGYTLHHHDHTDDAIKQVLRRIGERRFDIPDLPWRLKHNRGVHPTSEPWKVVKGGEEDSNGKPIAGLIERTGKHPHHIYYDAAGQVRVKPLNKEPVFTFDSSTMHTLPELTYDALDFANTIVVRGGKPHGKGKKRAYARVTLPAHHPLSPQAMARNGEPRYITKFVDAPNLKTDRDCRQRGHHLLQHHSEIGVEASFDCLPIPMFEELDEVKIETDLFAIRFPLKQFTIPLTADQPMTIGETKRVRTHRRHHDHRPPHHHPGRHHHRHHGHHHPGRRH